MTSDLAVISSCLEANMKCSGKCYCGKKCNVDHEQVAEKCHCNGQHNHCNKKCKVHGYTCDWIKNHKGDCSCFVERYGDSANFNCVDVYR